MVRNQIIWLLLLCIGGDALAFPAITTTPPTGIVLHWEGSKSPSCRHLVEAFLGELRSVASDRSIELDALPEKTPAASTGRQLRLACATRDPELLEVSDGSADVLPLRYLPKAGGFDATEWIPFQERYLRAPASTEVNLAPPPKIEPELPAVEPPATIQSSLSTSPASSPAIYQKWWFWALVGGVGATVTGVYLATHSSGNGAGSLNVEIH